METIDFVKLFFGLITLFVLYRLIYWYAFSRKPKEIEGPKSEGRNKDRSQNSLIKENVTAFMNYVDNFISKWRQDDEDAVYKDVLIKPALPVIPVFFACDNNYFPYLTVTLTSILANASKDYSYKFYVITTNLDEKYVNMLSKYESSSVEISVVHLREDLQKITEKFHLRDYYSMETYYRFFIANLFPQYDKVLYLDCDIAVVGDIAELYNTELGDNFVAAVPEEVMTEVDVFGEYVEKALDVNRFKYFNAGIMVMNLEAFRNEQIEEKFIDLLTHFKFRVTQDQDYLNVLCKNRVKILDLGWNKTAFKNDKFDDKDLKIVHFKIHWKPWHYKNVLYEDLFWEYARQTDFYAQLIDMRENYSQESKIRDEAAYKNLVQMAIDDTIDEGNYRNVIYSRKI
ncbi:MAG: glycosyltransferase family 8 protein [Treponemataceae bacterium]|nr:glycosyltransferase family 8 protein [Treponemataceae bacterium]